jgi:hypothetical protein
MNRLLRLGSLTRDHGAIYQVTGFHLSETVIIKEKIMNKSTLGNVLFAATIASSLLTIAQAKADDTGPQIRDHRCHGYPKPGCPHPATTEWQPGGTQQPFNKPIRQVPNLDNVQTLQEVGPPPQSPSEQRPRWPKRHFNQFQFANEAPGPSHGISCKQGRSIVRHQGFSHVRAIDCNGPIYSYRGMKSRYSGATIQVNLNGQIVAVNYWIAKR